MIVSHTYRYIFIKSHKTAGTSVEAALSNFCSGNDIVTPLGDYVFNRDENGAWVHKAMNPGNYKQHNDALTIKNSVGDKIWDNYFKFSITRNPWDRALSRFFWNHRNDPQLRPRRRFYHYLGVPFDELKIVRAKFKKFLFEESWDTNDRFHFIDGRLCVDFVIRYENLEHGLQTACQRLGLPEIILPRLKPVFVLAKDIIPSITTTPHGNWLPGITCSTLRTSATHSNSTREREHLFTFDHPTPFP